MTLTKCDRLRVVALERNMIAGGAHCVALKLHLPYSVLFEKIGMFLRAVGTIPPQFASLKNLMYLWLYQNKLSGEPCTFHDSAAFD